MQYHNKLVRDKIPDICRKNGDKPHIRILEDDTEYVAALTKKLIEEAHEVDESPTKEEIADLLEVTEALSNALHYSQQEIKLAMSQKARERGRFDQRIFLIGTENKQ